MDTRTELCEPVYRHTTSLASGIPLGGLGTGSVELRDDGCFHDWELFNNYQWSGAARDAAPEMWAEDAFFAVRVQTPGAEPRVRLLYDDAKLMRAADPHHNHAFTYTFPFLRHVHEITYAGQHPFAKLRYADPGLPLELSLQAFTPFIPHNSKDSGLPLAFFILDVANTGDEPCETSLMFSLRNCTGYDLDALDLHHRVTRDAETTRIVMTAENVDPAHRTAGQMVAGVMTPDATAMPAWTDGRGLRGFPNAATPGYCQLMYPFRDRGELDEEAEWRRSTKRRRDEECPCDLMRVKRQVGWRWRGALCTKQVLEPGAHAQVVFFMSWYFPNHYHYFSPELRLGHMYENWFTDADAAARYGAANFPRLYRESRDFCDALYAGTLPDYVKASLNAQLTTFAQSFWWAKDGDFTVWEGSACCQTIPNAHTPWSSWQPLLFFPDIYLQMKKRMLAFSEEPSAEASQIMYGRYQRQRAHQQERKEQFGGWFAQRYAKLGYELQEFVQARSARRRKRRAGWEAGPEQLLRDFQWTGDRELLELIWPHVHDSMRDAIAADENGDGLPDGAISFMTYDHWFVPATNCYKGTMWLASLSATAAMADIMGDAATAELCRATLARGAASFEKMLWNGEYYDLCYDPIKQANDPGCMADQVSGHLFLRLCGLDPVHDVEHVRRALAAVRRHNLKAEEGLLNGTDPNGRDDWRYFARYSAEGEDEALSGQWVTPWTGTEYYVAAVMIAEGLVKEGLDVVKNVYDRHVAVGMLYNHIECGEHYFRPMAVWAVLAALQGLVYDVPRGGLRIMPPGSPAEFDSLLLLPQAWGRVRCSQRDVSLGVEVGTLELRELVIPLRQVGAVCCNDERIEYEVVETGDGIAARFADVVTLKAGDTLLLTE